MSCDLAGPFIGLCSLPKKYPKRISLAHKYRHVHGPEGVSLTVTHAVVVTADARFTLDGQDTEILGLFWATELD